MHANTLHAIGAALIVAMISMGCNKTEPLPPQIIVHHVEQDPSGMINRLEHPTPLQLVSTQMLDTIATDVMIRGTVRETQKWDGHLELEDGSIIDLQVVKAWSAHSPTFSKLDGQVVTLQGDLSATTPPTGEGAGPHLAMDLVNVSVVSEAKAQRAELSGALVISSRQDINTKLLDKPISAIGILIRGDSPQAPGAQYMIACPDGSLLPISFVVEVQERVEQLLGREVTAYGRLRSTRGLVAPMVTIDGKERLVGVGLSLVLGIQGKDSHELIEPGHHIQEYEVISTKNGRL